MAIEIRVPSPGESITQVQVAKWLVADGDPVEKDQEVVEIDSDKASFPLVAPGDGTISILVSEGEIIPVGTIIATLNLLETGDHTEIKKTLREELTQKPEYKIPESKQDKTYVAPTHVSPLAGKILAEKNIGQEEVAAAYSGKRIGRREVESFLMQKNESGLPGGFPGERKSERRKLSMLRIKLAERLVSVKNETAMLTTFNEVNMRPVIEIKEQYTDIFREKHGVGIGLMSFFTKAVTLALREFPQVNSMLEGDDLVLPGYVDMGIAVSGPRGLVVPVLRNAEKMGIPDLEIRIKEMAVKAREHRITIDDMKGGTFTITNGGVFGSMLSTPILNPPQSAILGMHKIMDRPVAADGKVEIRPMMYLALSYDHRVIDGRESVSFLIKVKEWIENPLRMGKEGKQTVKDLLEI